MERDYPKCIVIKISARRRINFEKRVLQNRFVVCGRCLFFIVKLLLTKNQIFRDFHKKDYRKKLILLLLLEDVSSTKVLYQLTSPAQQPK